MILQKVFKMNTKASNCYSKLHKPNWKELGNQRELIMTCKARTIPPIGKHEARNHIQHQGEVQSILYESTVGPPLQMSNICNFFSITPKQSQFEVMGYNTSQFLSLIFPRNQRLATQAEPLESSSNHIHNGRKTLRLSLLKSDGRPKRRGISGLAMSPISAPQNNPKAGRTSHWSTCISFLGLCIKGQQTHPASNHSLHL